MAVTATTAVSRSIVPNAGRVDVTLTVFNTGGSDVTVTSINPIVVPNKNNATTQVALPIGRSAVVAAGGSTVFSWEDRFRVCLKPNSTDQMTFAVGAVILFSDGTYVVASQATIQVIPPQDPTVQPGTVYPYVPSSGPLAAVSSAVPLPGAAPNLPVPGQYRLEDNLNSGLVALM